MISFVRVVQCQNERVMAHEHDILFIHDIGLLLIFHHFFLVECLECEHSLAHLILYQTYAPKGALPELCNISQLPKGTLTCFAGFSSAWRAWYAFVARSLKPAPATLQNLPV